MEVLSGKRWSYRKDGRITAVFEDLACVRQKWKFWSRVNYQETFAHTRIRFGHVRARVVYTTSAFRCFMQDLRKPL